MLRSVLKQAKHLKQAPGSRVITSATVPSRYISTSISPFVTAQRHFTASSRTRLATPISTLFKMPTSDKYPTPPVQPPSFPSDPATIKAQVDQGIEATRQVYNAVAALSEADCTFESVVRPIAWRMAREAIETEPALFVQYVSTDAQVRDASVEADKAMQDFSLDSLTRIDVYKALRAAEAHTKKNNVSLNAEEQRLLDRMILDRTRAGLGLPDDKREELLAVQKEIMSLEVDFQKNCNEVSFGCACHWEDRVDLWYHGDCRRKAACSSPQRNSTGCPTSNPIPKKMASIA